MQLTVISGKGGTGKTTIAVAISELKKNTTKVDCDVDAPNMYLYYENEQSKEMLKEDFSGGKTAIVDSILCDGCGLCQTVCQFEAIKDGHVLSLRCEGCGACTLICPQKAIKLVDEKTADIMIEELENGLLIHSKMEVGCEGSGKLITVLRKKAQGYPTEGITVNDGSPGIGCPVISSVTAADAVLIVTEPTQSGVEDLKRVVQLCKQFGIKIFVCINKADINESITEGIQEYCRANELKCVGLIPYDETVLSSINELKPIIYYEESVANKAIREMWENMKGELAI